MPLAVKSYRDCVALAGVPLAVTVPVRVALLFSRLFCPPPLVCVRVCVCVCLRVRTHLRPGLTPVAPAALAYRRCSRRPAE